MRLYLFRLFTESLLPEVVTQKAHLVGVVLAENLTDAEQMFSSDPESVRLLAVTEDEFKKGIVKRIRVFEQDTDKTLVAT